MTNLEVGQKQRTRDFAQFLAGQAGTFLVSRPGTTLIVVCQDGYSIKSVRSTGTDYPSIPLGGSTINDIWEVEKLTSATEIPANDQGELSHSATGGQRGQQQSR